MTPAIQKPRWLVVMPLMPRADQASGDRRLVAMLRALAADCALDAVVLGPPDDANAAYQRHLESLGVTFLGYGMSAAVRALIGRAFDGVFFEFYFAAARLERIVRSLQPNATIIVDSVDVHYLREQEAARLGKLDCAVPVLTKVTELGVYSRADVTIVVSEPERQILEAEGVTRCVIVPNIVELVARTIRPRDPKVLFVGGFDHAPNAAAVHWFHDEIWPHVRRDLPDAEWIIAGSKVPPDVLAMHGRDGVNVVGFVASTGPWLELTQVSVAPLTFGGGMKGKVSEALAAGVPVVTTRWGAQGFEEGEGTAFLQAEEPLEFARAVVSLLRDEGLCARIGEAGRVLAQRLCSVDAAEPALRELVRLTARSKRASSMPRRILALADLAARRGFARLLRRSRGAVASR